MHESNGHTAFSYAAGNALDRVVANVTNAEEAREDLFLAEMEHGLPPTWLVANLAARPDIAVFALELRWQPMGYCIGADHDKQCICRPPDDRLPGFPGFYCSLSNLCRLQRPPEFPSPPECPVREQSDRSSIATCCSSDLRRGSAWSLNSRNLRRTAQPGRQSCRRR